MPTYEYSCTECGERLEVVQSFADDPLTVCPLCQGKLRKLFSAVGVVFKGSGFYKTDSRASKKKVTSSANGSSSEPNKSADSAGKSASTSSDSGSSGSGSSSGSSSGSESGSSSGSDSASKAGSSSSNRGSDSTGGDSKVA
jgi:putative FmdB family regulatory protein